VLAQSNDENAAATEFREALRIQPNYADAHANLAPPSSPPNTAAAVRELEKAVALAPPC